MGHPDTPLYREKEQGLGMRASLTVIAAGEHIDVLHTAKGAPWIEDARVIPLGLEQEITEGHLRGAGIVVVHIDPAVPSSMDRIEKIRSLWSFLPTNGLSGATLPSSRIRRILPA